MLSRVCHLSILMTGLLISLCFTNIASAQTAFGENPYGDRFAGAMPGEYQMPGLSAEPQNIEVYGFDSAAAPVAPYRPPAYRGGAPASTDTSVIVYPLSPVVPNALHYPARGALDVPEMSPAANNGYYNPPLAAPQMAPPRDPMEAYVQRYYARNNPQMAQRPGVNVPVAAPSGGMGMSAPAYTAPMSAYGSGYTPVRILFAHGSSRLSAQDVNVLRGLAKQFRSYPRGAKYIVQGHASQRAEANDPLGKRVANLKMSSTRAYQVSRRLILEGVPAAALETMAYGDVYPAGSEAQSRRVEIYIQAQ